jgi:hypothetical protein
MKLLRNAVEDYIALRRSLGFKLRATGYRLDRVRRFSGAERSALHHDGAGLGVGDAAG